MDRYTNKREELAGKCEEICRQPSQPLSEYEETLSRLTEIVNIVDFKSDRVYHQIISAEAKEQKSDETHMPLILNLQLKAVIIKLEKAAERLDCVIDFIGDRLGENLKL